jgi:hypothetical protein
MRPTRPVLHEIWKMLHLPIPDVLKVVALKIHATVLLAPKNQVKVQGGKSVAKPREGNQTL